MVQTDFFAETAEIEKFGRRKNTHFLDNFAENVWKNFADELGAFVSQFDDHKAAVGGIAFPDDMTHFLEIIDDQSKVAATAQEFLREFALT